VLNARGCNELGSCQKCAHPHFLKPAIHPISMSRHDSACSELQIYGDGGKVESATFGVCSREHNNDAQASDVGSIPIARSINPQNSC
jgi:hypothetical protein